MSWERNLKNIFNSKLLVNEKLKNPGDEIKKQEIKNFLKINDDYFRKEFLKSNAVVRLITENKIEVRNKKLVKMEA